jgi:hypothetical protein
MRTSGSLAARDAFLADVADVADSADLAAVADRADVACGVGVVDGRRAADCGLATVSAVLRADSHQLLRWVRQLTDGELMPPPPLSGASFARAGLFTGLTALATTLAAEHALTLPESWQAFAVDQREQVAQRVERFALHVPRVLGVLDRAGVVAIPVKGAVLAGEMWRHGRARPMADIDVVVPPSQRATAAGALIDAGFAAHGTASWEDTFLLWGDGTIGRRDGESVDHNGKLEIHPGWVERLHGYDVDDDGLLIDVAVPGALAGAPCRRLSPAMFAAQVIGHLSACVVRCEVRGVNVIDAVVALDALDAAGFDAFGDVIGNLDPRLTAPGLWLVDGHAARFGLAALVERELLRLALPARRLLRGQSPADVLRGDDVRTSWQWRRAFAIDAGEQLAVARQLVTGPADHVGMRAATRLQAARLGRAASRLGASGIRRVRRAAN